jgi:GH15 family glucan-1,4-alpha-glucosidase
VQVTRYPPIRDYGYIADCHTSALVSNSGSIDWCCMPRVDSKSCFGRLLDWDAGGYCRITPVEPCTGSRRYLPDTLVLETTFRTATGEARLLDCFTMRSGGALHPYRQLLRVLDGIRGRVDFRFEIVPRFDYGAIKPWIRCFRHRAGAFYVALGGSNGLLISGDLPLSTQDRHELAGQCSLEPGRRIRLSVLWRPPEELDGGRVDPPDSDTLDSRLEETLAWWRRWTSPGRTDVPYAEQARRSAIVLKGLSNAPTGAIAAAPTTSLPEAPGGPRNWDYRYSWVRDSSFAVNSLADLGYVAEAEGFRRFIERSAAGSAEELQILFGVGGERRLHEYEIPELEGYRGARPVRIGNAAEVQVQLDVYGELLELAWRWHQRGQSPDDDYREFLVGLVSAAAESWRRPDRGIWEMRGEPRHFVQSKAMCWAALDRGLRLLEDLRCGGPVGEWTRARDAIRAAIERYGYDPERGVFIQAFGCADLDAALLLLPTVGFVDFSDERMIRTTDAIRDALSENGLLRRYPAGNDGLEGREGVFLPCSFWLVECLARQGRLAEAHEVLRRALSTSNELGLFSEEYDTGTGEMLGNFPQGLTHLSLISATVALAAMEKPSPPERERSEEKRY